MTPWHHIMKEWQQSSSEDLNVTIGIHNTFKHTYTSGSFHANASPDMDFYWMFGPASTCKILTAVYMYASTVLHTMNEKNASNYLGLFLGFSPFFRQQNLLWVSSCTEHSSVQMTSRNPSFASSLYFCAHLSHFSLFASLIIWQYEAPLDVHPRSDLQRSMVLFEILYPRVVNRWCNCTTVVSSSLCMASSIRSLTSGVTIDGLPLPGLRAMEPDVQ